MAKTPEWLNSEFVEKVLKNAENDDTIKVKDVATKPATAKGDNYTSDMIRATVEYSRGKTGSKVTTEKKSIIIKISPTESDLHKEMIEKVRLFDTEIHMMENTLQKMNDLLSDGNVRLGARVLYTEIGDPSLLVIEDLAPLGFRMADRQAGLDLQHCLLAINRLAQFHASSVALSEKDPKMKDPYSMGMFNKKHPDIMKGFFKEGTKALARESATWSELPSECSQKISALVDVAYDRAAECAEPKEGEFNVLNHGDFWVNNMLFRYNDAGKVVDHIFVDFQLCIWTSPVVDILYFMNTSPNEEVSRKHSDVLLEEYYTSLTKTMSKLGCKTKPPTMANLEKSLKEREFCGVVAAFTILPLLLVDKSEAKSLDEIMQEGSDYENPSYKGKLYRKAIMRRLPDWNARGLLDA